MDVKQFDSPSRVGSPNAFSLMQMTESYRAELSIREFRISQAETLEFILQVTGNMRNSIRLESVNYARWIQLLLLDRGTNT